MKTFSVILVGAGMRGNSYTAIMNENPEKFRVVAVADPLKERRDKIKARHNLPEEMCFGSWEEVLSRPRFADIIMICTMDNMHYEPALKAIEQGYDIVLEKPVAPTAEQCVEIALAAKKKGVKVLVCHVLRYTPFYGQVKKLVRDGVIGSVMSMIQVEAVGNVHQSHSYVRGNWHDEKASAPMLLAKSSHDMDIVQWLVDKPCKRVQSFGDLTYFKAENAPQGAPVRCIDGDCPVRDTCPYDCKKLYLYSDDNYWFRPSCATGIAKAQIPTDEEVLTALQTTDYGLCVFHANNDVVDHQVVNMEFEGGATVSFTMNAFNEGGRYIRIFGTKGELCANMGDSEIVVYTFEDQKHHKYPVASVSDSILSGHGGGDAGLVAELYDYFSDDYNGYSAADIEISVKNHLLGFAAERSRRAGSVESIDDYMKQYGMVND